MSTVETLRAGNVQMIEQGLALLDGLDGEHHAILRGRTERRACAR